MNAARVAGLRTLADVAIRDGENWNDRRLPEIGRALHETLDELDRWFHWAGGRYPDDSPGDVIAADWDGTIVLDDGITTWNPLRALQFFNTHRPPR